MNLMKEPSMKWHYREMGSRNKKTGKLSYYNITVPDYKITNCECPSRDFHPFKACKHMIRLQEKLNHLTI